MTKDIRTFIRLLEQTHCDPYTNMGGKIAFKRRAQDLIEKVPASGLTAPELADRLGEFLAPLRDGHTAIRGARERWQDSSPPLGVQFGIASDGLFIMGSDLSDVAGMRGAKLLSVNGHSTADLLKALSSQIATENDYGSYVGLSKALHSYKLLKNLISDLEHERGLDYELLTSDSKQVHRHIAWENSHSDDPEQWREKPMRWPGRQHQDDPFYYTFLDGGRAAYFRIANMMPREGYEVVERYKVGNLQEMLGQYYTTHHREMPADIDAAMKGVPSLFEQGTSLLQEMKRRGTESLVLDFRGNGGGSTPVIVPFFYELFGDDYFARISSGETVHVVSPLYLEKYNSSVEEQRKKEPNFELGEYVFHEPESLSAQEKREKRLADFREHGFSFSPAIDALNGKPLYRPHHVIALCDPGTFSAAFQAVFLLHEAGATVVGVPPAQSPNAFMEATEFTLPESGIRGYISNGTQMFMPDQPTANVYHPDFESSYSVFRKYDFDEDASLRYALDVIASGRTK